MNWQTSCTRPWQNRYAASKIWDLKRPLSLCNPIHCGWRNTTRSSYPLKSPSPWACLTGTHSTSSLGTRVVWGTGYCSQQTRSILRNTTRDMTLPEASIGPKGTHRVASWWTRWTSRWSWKASTAACSTHCKPTLPLVTNGAKA